MAGTAIAKKRLQHAELAGRAHTISEVVIIEAALEVGLRDGGTKAGVPRLSSAASIIKISNGLSRLDPKDALASVEVTEATDPIAFQ